MSLLIAEGFGLDDLYRSFATQSIMILCCPANVLPLPCAGQQPAAPVPRDVYIWGERQFGEMQRSACTCCSHLNTSEDGSHCKSVGHEFMAMAVAYWCVV